jgi:hypothetical protein
MIKVELKEPNRYIKILGYVKYDTKDYNFIKYLDIKSFKILGTNDKTSETFYEYVVDIDDKILIDTYDIGMIYDTKDLKRTGQIDTYDTYDFNLCQFVPQNTPKILYDFDLDDYLDIIFKKLRTNRDFIKPE